MKMSRKTAKASRSVKAGRVISQRPRTKRIMAETDVAAEAADLLFEAEDVAELVAEITGEDVAVEADGESVTFEVAGETYTCEAEEEIEEVEASRKIRSGKRVAASRTIPASKRKIARRR